MNTKLVLAGVTTLVLSWSSVASAQNPNRAERIKRFLDNHPAAKEKVEAWKQLTPEQRQEKLHDRVQQFLEKHPRAKEKLEAWKKLTPDERQQKLQNFLEKHPRAAARLEKHPKLSELSQEFPGVTIRALRHPRKAKHLEAALERNPEKVREKLKALRAALEQPAQGR